MPSYSEIRTKARKQHSSHYATGGRVAGKKPGTVVNVIVPPSGGQQGTPMPPPAAINPKPPMPPQMPPVNPIAGNAALSAMGGQPQLKTGGRVKAPAIKAGAASGEHRTVANKKSIPGGFAPRKK